MSSVAILQARTTSSRLPAKVLLPIGEMPLVVLAAKRAGNTGRKVIVVTSTDTTDDYLAGVLKSHGVACCRGSLENTLSRFVDALAPFDDDTIVFRLTGDNVLPDGRLLDEVEFEFLQTGVQYLACNGVESGLPYGMSVEVMRLKSLRDAHKNKPSTQDQEHVTPAIIKTHGARHFIKYLDRNMGHYRCTVDNLDDYLVVAQLFNGESDPVGVSGLQLIERLKEQSFQPLNSKVVPRLILGTAQLGLNYGIANTTGKPKQNVANQLIKTAIVNGAVWIDTAYAYGDSEAVIGNALAAGWQGRAKVVTKLSPLAELLINADPESVNTAVDASVFRSLSALRQPQIDVLLLHRADHLRAYEGRIWKRVLEHKQQGRIKSVGVSVQTPEELDAALAVADITHIQLPINVLDGRWYGMEAKILEAKASRCLVLHARSIYLQGLLLSQDESHWMSAGLKDVKSLWVWLDDLRQRLRLSSLKELCVAYVNGLHWVDGLVMGVETLKQLDENIRLLQCRSLTKAEIEMIQKERPVLPASLLNPVAWSK